MPIKRWSQAQVWDLTLQYSEYGVAWRKTHTNGKVLNALFFYAQWYTEHNSAHLITIPTLFSPASCEANSVVRERAPLFPAWSCVCMCVAALWPTNYHQQPKRRPSLPNWMVEKPCKKKMPFLLLKGCRCDVYHHHKHPASKRRRQRLKMTKRTIEGACIVLTWSNHCELLQTSLHTRKTNSLCVSLTFFFFYDGWYVQQVEC